MLGSVVRGLAAYFVEGELRYGAVRDDGIVDFSRRHAARWSSFREVIADGALARLVEEGAKTAVDYALGDVRFSIPVPAPEKILCVGVNYPERNAEYKDGQGAPEKPSLFVRFPRSFVGHGDVLRRPFVSEQLDYEGEVALVMGRSGRHIAERDAHLHVAALTLANDGSVRDWIRHGKFNVTQGKNFDASGAIGPWLVTFTDAVQLDDVRLSTRVNGETRQDDRTSRMMFNWRRLIAYISTFTTLVPGDIILTGTPTGAGARFDPPKWLKPGDVVEIEADGLGVLRNCVADEPRAHS